MDYKAWSLFVLVIVSTLIYGTIAYPKHLYCKEEFSSGYGKKNEERYYYNINRQECNMFIYSGRGGTLNNFKTLDECILACANVTTELHNQHKMSYNKH